MTTTPRTDVHRPAELVPENYVEVGWYDLGTAEERPCIFLSPAARASDDVWVGQYGADLWRCDHCGANMRYGAELVHEPTGGHIHVGETCLGNRFSLSSTEFHRMRKAAQLDRQAQAILSAWTSFQAERPEIDWKALEALRGRISFVDDVLAKGRRYGALSDRQVAALAKVAEREAQPRAERNEPTWLPVPTQDRLAVTGRVLTTKYQESDFGATLKMLVQVDVDGGSYKLWGTVHNAICDVNKGDTVSFSANVFPSTKDETFGLYKRPTKATITERNDV